MRNIPITIDKKKFIVLELSDKQSVNNFGGTFYIKTESILEEKQIVSKPKDKIVFLGQLTNENFVKSCPIEINSLANLEIKLEKKLLVQNKYYLFEIKENYNGER